MTNNTIITKEMIAKEIELNKVPFIKSYIFTNTNGFLNQDEYDSLSNQAIEQWKMISDTDKFVNHIPSYTDYFVDNSIDLSTYINKLRDSYCGGAYVLLVSMEESKVIKSLHFNTPVHKNLDYLKKVYTFLNENRELITSNLAKAIFIHTNSFAINANPSDMDLNIFHDNFIACMALSVVCADQFLVTKHDLYSVEQGNKDNLSSQYFNLRSVIRNQSKNIK